MWFAVGRGLLGEEKGAPQAGRRRNLFLLLRYLGKGRNLSSPSAAARRRCAQTEQSSGAGSAPRSPAADVSRQSVGLWRLVAMAVDITLLFRASVKTVKTRNKVLGVAVGGGVDGNRDELFRRSPRPKGDFSSRAREVVSWLLWERGASEWGGSATRTPGPTRDPGREHGVNEGRRLRGGSPGFGLRASS